MKRLIKRLAAVLVAAGLCLSLCSCGAIEEMREQRADYKDASRETIVYGGQEYRLLPAYEEKAFSFCGVWPVRVSEPEVPLLAAQLIGDSLYATAQKTVITDDYSTHYCRADLYDDYCRRIEEGVFPYLCALAYEESQEVYIPRRLNDTGMAYITAALQGQEETYDEELYENSTPLYACDAQTEILGDPLDLVKLSDGRFFLDATAYEYSSDPSRDYEYYTTYTYPLPAESFAYFDAILEAGW